MQPGLKNNTSISMLAGEENCFHPGDQEKICCPSNMYILNALIKPYSNLVVLFAAQSASQTEYQTGYFL